MYQSDATNSLLADVLFVDGCSESVLVNVSSLTDVNKALLMYAQIVLCLSCVVFDVGQLLVNTQHQLASCICYSQIVYN